MRARYLGLAGLAMGVLAIGLGTLERKTMDAVAHAEQDGVRLGVLLSAATDLEENTLELRAGMQRNFDPLDQAVLSLRAARHESTTIRGRGASYGEAADALDRVAEGLTGLEPQVERLKTDIALWRLSSRSFFLASEIVGQPDEATDKVVAALQADLAQFHQQGATPEATWRIANESAALDLGLTGLQTQSRLFGPLRLDVERFQDQPTRNIAQRIEGEIATLDAARASAREPATSNLGEVLGHARSILDRRERLERTVRTLARSALRAEAATASTAYARAARHQYGLEWVLGVGVAEAVLAALALLGAAVRGASRRSRVPRVAAARARSL